MDGLARQAILLESPHAPLAVHLEEECQGLPQIQIFDSQQCICDFLRDVAQRLMRDADGAATASQTTQQGDANTPSIDFRPVILDAPRRIPKAEPELRRVVGRTATASG